MDGVGSTADYILSDNIEYLGLTGPGSIGTGNALDNIIVGRNSYENISYVLSGLEGSTVVDDADVVKGRIAANDPILFAA